MAAPISFNACRILLDVFTKSQAFPRQKFLPKTFCEMGVYIYRPSGFYNLKFGCHFAKQISSASKDSIPFSSALSRSRRHNLLPQAIEETVLQIRSDCINDRNQTFYSTSLRQQIKRDPCWNCGLPKHDTDDLFFCECGAVQAVTNNVSYFQLFGLSENYNVDKKVLSDTYINLQKLLHPDKFSNAKEKAKVYAEEQSSLINKAYSTLSKPLSRALYLLRLNNKPIEEKAAISDPEFLAEIMEINEEIAEISSKGDLEEIEKNNSDKIDMCIKDVTEAFNTNDITRAHEIVIKYQYYANITEKIKEIRRKWMV